MRGRVDGQLVVLDRVPEDHAQGHDGVPYLRALRLSEIRRCDVQRLVDKLVAEGRPAPHFRPGEVAGARLRLALTVTEAAEALGVSPTSLPSTWLPSFVSSAVVGRS